MKELIQAGTFYRSLNKEEQDDLCNAIAADIYFLDEELQRKVIRLLMKVDRKLAEEICRRNGFTR